MLSAILFNSVAMASEPANLAKGSAFYQVLFALDVGFTLIFTLEMSFKILAHGLYSIPGAP